VSELTKKRIAEAAASIRKIVEGGHLYGEPIDMADPDVMLIAAFCAGQTMSGQAEVRRVDDFSYSSRYVLGPFGCSPFEKP
jgi:hypothetical protein